MEYLLYKLAPGAESVEKRSEPKIPGKCVTFSPLSLRWILPMLRAGGIEFIKVIILATWTVVARVSASADTRIWAYIGQNGSVLHYSVVTSTAMHLPWLARANAGGEIGGCITVPDARGMRIYPHILQRVAASAGFERPLYMIVESTNVASRAGIERAGFEVAHAVQRESRFCRPPIYACADKN